MSSLIRIKQGNFKIEDSFSLKDIENNNYKLLKAEEILDYPRLYLNEENVKTVKNGGKLPNLGNYQVLCMYQDKCLAIYESNNEYLKSYIQL